MDNRLNLERLACWLETRCLQPVRSMQQEATLGEKLNLLDQAQLQLSFLLLALDGKMRIEGVDIDALNEAKDRLEKLGLYRK